MPEYGTCKGCGARIIWATTEDGKRIPIDPKPAIYELFWGEEHPITHANVTAYRKPSADLDGLSPDGFGVSHFATCPDANEFSRTRKTTKEH